jgi:hypothetical protein
MIDANHVHAMDRLLQQFVCPRCGPSTRPVICVHCLKVLCRGGCSAQVSCSCDLARTEMLSALHDVVIWREGPEGPKTLFPSGAAMMKRVRRAIDIAHQAGVDYGVLT